LTLSRIARATCGAAKFAFFVIAKPPDLSGWHGSSSQSSELAYHSIGSFGKFDLAFRTNGLLTNRLPILGRGHWNSFFNFDRQAKGNRCVSIAEQNLFFKFLVGCNAEAMATRYT
jgi:hypothetical protein